METKRRTENGVACGSCGMKGFCGVQAASAEQARPNPRAIVLAYVVPLFLLLAGVVVGSLFSNVWAFVGGLLPVALWFLLVIRRI